MPKLLYVLRHAKSSWDDRLLPDHERPLSDRGRRAVALLSAHCEREAITPELVLCSSARRTRETLAGVLPGRTGVIERDLYGATAGALIARLHDVAPETPSVMVIGHNPALQRLVLTLAHAPVLAGARADRAGGEPETVLQQIERKFPTGALAVLAFDGEWARLGSGDARLADYVRPKALA